MLQTKNSGSYEFLLTLEELSVIYDDPKNWNEINRKHSFFLTSGSKRHGNEKVSFKIIIIKTLQKLMLSDAICFCILRY